MAAKLFQSEVATNQKLNYKFHLIRLRLVENQELFNFQSGQFLIIKIGSSVYRSYSVASQPTKLPDWQLFVDVTPGGPGSTYLKTLKPGQIIQHSDGRGTFVIKKKAASYNIMAATGCGIASIIPLTEELLQSNNKVLLLWGLRYQKDLCLIEWLKSISDNLNFSYKIVLSKPSVNWEGIKGHITDVFLKEVRSVPFYKQNIYLCGNQAMINDVKSLLQKINFIPDRLFFERYY